MPASKCFFSCFPLPPSFLLICAGRCLIGSWICICSRNRSRAFGRRNVDVAALLLVLILGDKRVNLLSCLLEPCAVLLLEPVTDLV